MEFSWFVSVNRSFYYLIASRVRDVDKTGTLYMIIELYLQFFLIS